MSRAPRGLAATLTLALALALAAACGGGGGGARAVAPGPRDGHAEPVGLCPDEPDLSLALGLDLPGGDRRWALVGTLVRDDPHRFFPGKPEDEEAFVDIDAAAAAAAGAPALDGTVWLYAKVDAPPCPMEPAGWVAVRRGDAGLFVAVHRLLRGRCDVTYRAFALRTPTAPAGCYYREAKVLGARVDGQPSPLPSDVATLLELPACAAPACDLQWQRVGFDLEPGARVEQWAVARVFPKADVEECAWEVQQGFDVLQAEPGGALLRWNPTIALLAEESFVMPLTGALHDPRGLRVVVTEVPGWYKLHDVRPGRLPRARPSEHWTEPHPEDWAYAFPRLGPACGL